MAKRAVARKATKMIRKKAAVPIRKAPKKVEAGKKVTAATRKTGVVSKVSQIGKKVGFQMPMGYGASDRIAAVQELVAAGVPKAQAARMIPEATRRSKGMFMRKGKLFMGYTQKEVKNAMRRTYGGRRKK